MRFKDGWVDRFAEMREYLGHVNHTLSKGSSILTLSLEGGAAIGLRWCEDVGYFEAPPNGRVKSPELARLPTGTVTASCLRHQYYATSVVLTRLTPNITLPPSTNNIPIRILGYCNTATSQSSVIHIYALAASRRGRGLLSFTLHCEINLAVRKRC